jgi:dTDP-4-dehydrorhamnose reductase
MDRTKVAIFGSSGQLGTDLVDVLGQSTAFEVIPLMHEDADCTDASAVKKVLLAARPQIVINSAAFVRVDDCEDHPEEAFRVNAIGAFHIAKACAEIDALNVYISTDYVFDGSKETPYVESDVPNPINVYGASKLAGEHLVMQAAPRWLIVRVASLFGKTGARGKGGNFIETILTKAKQGEALKVVDDIRISPTYTRDAAAVVRRLLESESTGIVHAANAGSCTWYEFAKTALAFCGIDAAVTAVSSATYRTAARRPRNSALGSEQTGTALRVRIISWEQGLQAYLMEKGHAAMSARKLGNAR